MSFGKRKLKEEKLAYFEEMSYMLVISKEDVKDLMDKVFDRVANIDGVQVKDTVDLTDKTPGKIKLIYDNEEYEVNFYPLSLPLLPIIYNYLSRDDVEEVKTAKGAFVIFMKFGEEVKKAYHLQLKLAVAMDPNLIGILDESAEKFISSKLAIMTANSKVVPGPKSLYTIQAVTDNDEVWLHTHGLCRCGITELEILQSDKENCNNHCNIISVLASYLIDKRNEIESQKNTAYIGILSNNQPILVNWVSWTIGLNEYKKLNLGNIKDRKANHNSRTSIIFIYKDKQAQEQGKITKVPEYNKLWKDNPVFFISNEETARMKALAMERFYFVENESKKKENEINIKIALKIDNEDNCEHIWFELVEFKEDKFKARLLQEPYEVANIHVGDERWFSVEDVTDWIIYTPNSSINPDNAYLLV